MFGVEEGVIFKSHEIVEAPILEHQLIALGGNWEAELNNVCIDVVLMRFTTT